MDLGPPAVQYVHYPGMQFNLLRTSEPCPWPELLWARLLWPIYVRIAYHLSRSKIENIRRNMTLTNSHWTAQQYVERVQGTVERVLYPPPLGAAKGLTSQDKREEAFLTIGRIEPHKDWLSIIAIVEKIRARGHRVSLTLAGSPYDDEFLALLRGEVEKRDWVNLRVGLPRQELDLAISRHAFGIHGKKEEPYGMAVAELVLGGCLTFVPDSGGQVEIASLPEVCFSGVEQAVDKICSVLSDPKLRENLSKRQAVERKNITREAFQHRFRSFLDDLEAGRVQPGSYSGT